MLSATGTASSSTFLRGDNTWVTPTDTNTTYSVTDGQLSEYNFTAAFRTKVNAIEASATADQTAGEILTLLEDGIDSVHYKNGSIDNEHIADNAINSEHYADGSIDNAHIADDAIDSEHYAAGSIDTAHIADNQITLAKMASGTDGNIISYDASGNPVAIATGTDGQVLTSTGAGSPPAFEDAAGGGGSVRTVTAGGQTLGSGETLAFTAGTNITITESGGAVTINNSAAAFSAGTDDDFEIPNQFSGMQNPMTGAIVVQIDGTQSVSVTDGIIQSYS